jgi:Glycosyltransferase family 9 (heptosyltransferase)
MSWKMLKRFLPMPIVEQAREAVKLSHISKNAVYAQVERLRVRAQGGRLPEKMLLFGAAPGDDLLCTAVLRELRKRGHKDMWMVSDYPELFAGMDDAYKVIQSDSPYVTFAASWKREVKRLEYATYDGIDQSVPPSRHIIAELCKSAGINGPVTLRPYLKLREEEKEMLVSFRGSIIVQSSGINAKFPMLNKQWFPDRFQAVVDELYKEFEFVQLGSIADPPLRHVRDLRGKTAIRDAAVILSHARLYIGAVGFLMHLARAVECPSVIVYGGREAPWQSGYGCNVNLASAIPCAPCWRWNGCDFDRKCMVTITAEKVFNAVRKLIAIPQHPLVVETAIIE